MVAIKHSFLLLPFCTALALVLPRSTSPDFTLITRDLRNLDLSVLALKSSLLSYSGGFLATAPILAGVIDAHLANREGYYDALTIELLSVADSFAIVQQINSTLTVDIPATVEVMVAKKKLFDEAGRMQDMLEGLGFLRRDHETFSAALLAKIAPESQGDVAYIVKVIDDSLKSGIASLSS